MHLSIKKAGDGGISAFDCASKLPQLLPAAAGLTQQTRPRFTGPCPMYKQRQPAAIAVFAYVYWLAATAAAAAAAAATAAAASCGS
jgi:hypothetical protein